MSLIKRLISKIIEPGNGVDDEEVEDGGGSSNDNDVILDHKNS